MKRLIARFWPVLRLRSIMFILLLVVAALPGVAAIGLRVYENALVRRTEAELIAQGSALAASTALGFAGDAASAAISRAADPRDYDDRTISTSIDLRTSSVLGERPDPVPTALKPDPAAADMAKVWSPVIDQTRQITLASIMLLDRHGVVLNGRDAGKSLAALPEVRTALAGSPVTTLRHNGSYTRSSALEWISRATDIRLHHARPIIANGHVVGVVLLSRSPRALFRGMYEDRGKIAAGTAAIFLFLVAITAALGRTIVRPLEALSRATRALAEGRRAAPPQPTLRVQEIDSLIRDFATMAAAIEVRSHYLRDFATALAHEFKTPLTGLSGGIELLQDHGSAMSDEEYAGFLANMAADTQRLNRLISRLLDLAKADMQRPHEGASCDLADVLARIADGLGTTDFTIDTAAARIPARLRIDGSALETALTTLIDNARAAGAGQVTLAAALIDDHLQLTVSDNGSGIAPNDRPRIFEPFFTSKRAQGGTGLGLPIARALIEGNGGSLTLRDKSDGTCFLLILPCWPPGT
ncbi:HAMP domain-containing sensor histidine kinase [Novosphingobium sp.]|uniref:sensor histidine kinase n=1 Tax=Novosphingobium sp. TaxID=1874826 RepID=UPI0026276D4B|nr:HAMP domain-containing sensor histidine kinase [Novosphingobium sp.]